MIDIQITKHINLKEKTIKYYGQIKHMAEGLSRKI